MNKNNSSREEKEKVLWALMLALGYIRPVDMPRLGIHENTASNWKKRHAVNAKLIGDILDVIIAIEQSK